MELSAKHLQTFRDQGFVVVENFYPEEKRRAVASAIRESLPPWDEIADDPPAGSRLTDSFPFEQMFFNHFILDWELISFVQQALESEDIHFRYAHNWARYPDPDGVQLHLHIDNGNNSLLPPIDDQRYGQISSWYFPESVAADQAPMRIVPKSHGDNLDEQILLIVPAGTLMIFNTHVWHSATLFTGDSGQRYSATRIYGRGDHYWEGVGYYTNQGNKQPFRDFIGSLTARERQIFRFPPPGHSYYTEETLVRLEEQYPGWNAAEEYA